MQKYSDQEFHNITENEPPRELVIFLNNLIPESSVVIDLGCGSGVDSHHFIENGHSVIAIDREVSVIEKKRMALKKEQMDRLKIIQADFNEMNFPKADVIYASYSLPFCGHSKFMTVWETQFETLSVNTMVGIVLFGQKDEWFGHNDYLVFHSEDAAKELFNSFEILHYENVEYEGSCMGPANSIINKHWHVINVVAVKK